VSEESTQIDGVERVVRFDLAYDGSDYNGWQIQAGQPTIQEEFQRAVRRVLSAPTAVVVAAGRTDSGVHAVGQVAHVRTTSPVSCSSLVTGINSMLARDLRVLRAVDASPDFHARFSAIAKEYRYQIWNGRVMPPFVWRHAMGWRAELDHEAMARAAALFEGTHDLRSFRSSACTQKSPIRTVHEARVARHGSMIVFAIRARGFLQHMVRIMSGTLLAVGRGLLDVDDVAALLDARDRTRVPATAPATGLFLVRVEYPQERTVEATPDPVINFEIPWT